jgi:hypothetical protein
MTEPGGQGMDKPTISLIVEPFVTSPEVGREAVLGLSITLGLSRRRQTPPTARDGRERTLHEY